MSLTDLFLKKKIVVVILLLKKVKLRKQNFFFCGLQETYTTLIYLCFFSPTLSRLGWNILFTEKICITETVASREQG